MQDCPSIKGNTICYKSANNLCDRNNCVELSVLYCCHTSADINADLLVAHNKKSLGQYNLHH